MGQTSAENVKIEASNNLVKFKTDGGSKNLDVLCNSSVQYSENSNENWVVDSKPDWIIITINKNKKKGGLLGKMKEKAENVKEKVAGKEEIDPSMIKTSITLTADPLPKADKTFFDGRKGQVVLRSGDATYTIEIIQNSGDFQKIS